LMKLLLAHCGSRDEQNRHRACSRHFSHPDLNEAAAVADAYEFPTSFHFDSREVEAAEAQDSGFAFENVEEFCGLGHPRFVSNAEQRPA
jgi:hypothetical protein